MTTRWNRVTIVGCGLIGASFALALRRANLCSQIVGWDASSSVLDEAVRTGVIDEVDQAFKFGNPSEGNSSSEMIYLAMPVGEIIEFLTRRAQQVKPGAIITDAGSTKVEVCRTARLHLREPHQFVGGHPVAGSHLQGLAHAQSDLFAGAPYVLIRDEDGAATPAYTRLSETIGLLGAEVRPMTAAKHDRAMGLVSHVPQIVSSSLAAVIEDQPDADALVSLAGAGYRDMTRLASSSWSIWGDILRTNSADIVTGLEELVQKLTAVCDELRVSGERGGELKITGSLFDETGTSKSPARKQNASYPES